MWTKIFEKGFFLHTNPRPKIFIHHKFKNSLIAVEVEKNEGYDIRFAGWLAPVTFSPHGNIYGQWRRIYFNQIQQFLLQPQELLGSLEIIPKLWFPNIFVKVWVSELQVGSSTDLNLQLSRLEAKIDDISTYNR